MSINARQIIGAGLITLPIFEVWFMAMVFSEGWKVATAVFAAALLLLALIGLGVYLFVSGTL